MKTTIATLIAATALGSSVALAGNITPAPQEPAVIAPAPAPARADGDWGGFYGGAQLGWGTFDADGGTLNESEDGVVGGLHAGYNWDLGNWVLGAEADIDGSDIDFASGGGIDSITRLKLRAGPDLGRTFLYATLGGAYADGDVAGTGFSEWGYVAGVGVDYQLNERWVLGADALYHQIDDITPAGDDLDGTTVRARASLRF